MRWREPAFGRLRHSCSDRQQPPNARDTEISCHSLSKISCHQPEMIHSSDVKSIRKHILKRARFPSDICLAVSFRYMLVTIHISTYHLRVTGSIMLIYTTTTSSYQACSTRLIAIILPFKQRYAFSAFYTLLKCVLASC